MLFTTFLFWYRPIFMLQLLVAEYLFTFRLRRRKAFVWRAIGSAAVCFGLSFAFPVGEYSFNAAYCSFMFLSLFAVSVGALLFTFEERFSDILFCALAGYTVQHISQEMYEILSLCINPAGGNILDFYGSGEIDFESLSQNWGMLMIHVLTYLVTYCLIYFLANLLFASKIQKYNILSRKTKLIVVLVAFILLVDVVFSAIITYMVPQQDNFVVLLLLHIYNIACGILTIVLLFEWPRRKYIEREYALTCNLLQRADEKFNTSKETVEQINIKCHDMKHQLRQLAEKSNMTGSALAEMENLINIYDATYQTANEAFNIILMEKSLLCQKSHITLSCIADGSLLSFMSDADVYALFGNLLDNAIEAVTPLDESKRSIGMSVKALRRFLMINAYNNYEGRIECKGGLPATTKKDRENHGYGLKSMKRIVEKYGGEMTVSAEGGVFDVNIVFPLPDPEQEKKG